MSLRRRILIGTGLAMLAGLLVADVITFLLVTRSQLNQVDDALQRAHTPTEQIAEGDPADWPLIPQIAPGLYVAIVDRSGSAVFTSEAREPGDDPLSIDLNDVRLGEQNQTVPANDGDQMRIRVDPVNDDLTIIVGQSLHEVNETQSRLIVVLGAATATAIAAALALAWWMVNVGLRPLRVVEASAAAITDEALGDSRVPGSDQSTEVGRLAKALNAMLDRLELARTEREETVVELRASEARMRQFVADASHELRTPMAATAAYAELFETGARERPDDLERAMAGIRSETARMSDLVDDLLLLARLDEQRPVATGTADLTEIVLAAVDTARALAPERSLKAGVSGVVTVEGDATRLRQVVDNLLANVRSHTPADATCSISLSVDDGKAVIVVADTGPGVGTGQLAHLGDRFYRVDEARTRVSGGNGLGLSITKAIVATHRGTIDFAPNQPQGLVATIRLPNAHLDSPKPGA